MFSSYSVTSDLIIYILYIFAFLVEVYYLKTEDKDHFLIAVGLIVVGSWITFLNYSAFTIIPYFTIAMTLSIIGDAFMAKKLQLTGERIIDGILAFALAHIAYIYAFNQTTLDSYKLWYVIPSAVALLALYFFVLYNPKAKPELRIGSFVYTLVIIALFVTVLRFALTDHVPIKSILASLFGVSLFILSDSLIAFNEFKKELVNAEKYISLTYIIAQILLQTTPLLLL